MMDRQKAIKLALEVYGTGFFTEAAQDCLMEFVEKVERELRGDAKPVAWQYHDEVSGQWVTGMNTNNHREHTQNAGYKTRDLYAHTTPAVVHVDAEPVLYQYRMRPLFDCEFPWSAWAECSKEVFHQYERQQVWGGLRLRSQKIVFALRPRCGCGARLLVWVRTSSIYKKAI